MEVWPLMLVTLIRISNKYMIPDVSTPPIILNITFNIMTSSHSMESTSANGGGILSRMALNDNKAGMEGLDRERINKIIIESSKVDMET